MTKHWLGIGGVAAGVAAVVIGVAVAVASCSQTPTNVPVRSLQQSQKSDVVCLGTLQEDGGALIVPQIPLAQEQCAPVPANVTGSTLPNHLYSVVTQTTRGEVAVIDLTAGQVIDEDKSTPGINFIPVGGSPTDVAVTPDGYMTFVATAEEDKPAIYAIPNSRLLGDYGGQPPLKLTDLQACLLAQVPQALAIATRPDGKTVLLVMVRGSDTLGTRAGIVAIDPAPLTQAWPDGGGPPPPDAAAAERAADAAPPLPPGTLTSCPVIGGVALSNTLPASWTPGPAWPDGVPYADAGAATEPTAATSCGVGAPADAGVADSGGAGDAGEGGLPLSFAQLGSPHPASMALRDDVHLLYVADEAIPVIHVIDVSDPTAPHEQAPLLATSVLNPARRVIVGPMALSPTTSDFKRYLYAVDTRDKSLMVFDVSDPAASPRVPLQRPHPELNPFAAPDRLGFSAPIASLAFVEHDWPLPSQSDAEAPNPIHQYSGLLCNPNPNVHPDAGAFLDLGAFYRVDQAALIQPSGARETFPNRLRGVFAFVTLSNGSVVVIDVDDWDAPCRRPDPMAAGDVKDLAGVTYTVDAGIGQTGLLAIPQPPPGATPDAGQFEPYHAPLTYNSNISESPAVTLEPFFPVSAPHRMRANTLLMNDPVSGEHIPYLSSAPALFDVNGAPQGTSAGMAATRPLMLPTLLPPGWIDYSYLQTPIEPNPAARTWVSPDMAFGSCAYPASLLPQTGTPSVRLSFDDPSAHIDQDWTVTYEGVLPTVSGVVGDMVLDDQDGQTMTMYATGARLCEAGVEDWQMGQARVAQLARNLPAVGLPVQPPDRAQWTADYIEITDDLLDPSDPYWSLPASDAGASEAGAGADAGNRLPVVNDCWEGDLANATADARYNFCLNTFGTAANADTYLSRDFPILEANDDYLRVGRFGWVDRDTMGNAVAEASTNRVVVAASDTNKTFLHEAQCCFHHQAGFKVRAGGEWLTVGSSVGMLNHEQSDPRPDGAFSRPTLGWRS